MRRFVVKKSEGGEQLKNFLHRRVGGGISLRQVKRWLDERRCRIDGRIERVAGRLVEPGMHIVLWTEEREAQGVSVLFEDEFLVAYDKPPGLVFDAVRPAGLFVHRLDKETSGVLLLAKTQTAQEAVQGVFRDRKIFKRYLAVVEGMPKQASGVVKNRLTSVGKRAGQPIWGPSRPGTGQGKTAITRFQVIARRGDYSLVACVPETGRTHQIRVHLAGLGCPVVGDVQYGSGFVESNVLRHLLHAHRLVFDHPFTGNKVRIEAKPPKEFW